METQRKTPSNNSGARTSSRERARRRVRRSRKYRPTKTTRYLVSIVTILLVFFIAYSIGSWIFGNIYDSATNKESPEDTIATLQSRLDDLTARNNELAGEVEELQAQLERYNSQYGPLDSPSLAQ